MKRNLLFISFFVCCMISFAITAEEKEGYAEQQQRLEKEMKKMEAGRKIDFDIKGTVLGEDGTPLNNVAVNIEQAVYRGFMPTVRSEIKKVINQDFDFTAKGQHSVTLDVTKDGYYNETIFISNESGKYKGMAKDKKLVINDLKVVLKKIGKIASLLKYRDNDLKVYDGGKAFIIDFAPEKRNKEVIVENIFDTKRIPPDSVYMTADMKDEKIESVMSEDLSGYTREVPKKLTMKMSDPEGGFIVYKPSSKMFPLREMREAPKDGYKNEIILSGNSYNRTNTNKKVYFYFRTNGKYGKGFINGMDWHLDEGEVRLFVRFFLNPIPEDRNVNDGQ